MLEPEAKLGGEIRRTVMCSNKQNPGKSCSSVFNFRDEMQVPEK